MRTFDLNLSKDEMNIAARDVFEAVNGTPLFVDEFPTMEDAEFLKLITVAQYVFDLCVNEAERRDFIHHCDCCGDPSFPYASDHVVHTILTRADEADGSPEPPTAH